MKELFKYYLDDIIFTGIWFLIILLITHMGPFTSIDFFIFVFALLSIGGHTERIFGRLTPDRSIIIDFFRHHFKKEDKEPKV